MERTADHLFARDTRSKLFLDFTNPDAFFVVEGHIGIDSLRTSADRQLCIGLFTQSKIQERWKHYDIQHRSVRI